MKRIMFVFLLAMFATQLVTAQDGPYRALNVSGTAKSETPMPR